MVTSVSELGTTKNLRGHYAGLFSRLTAFVIDTVFLSTFVVFFSWFFKTSLTMFQLHQLIQFEPHLKSVYAFIASPLFGNVASFVLVVFYYVFFWSLSGQSIGKAVMGVKIVPLAGGKMSFTRALIRFIGFFISTIPLGLGFWWILVDDRRAAWHDHLAKTVVVYNWDAKPDEKFLVDAIKKMDTSR